MGGVQTIQTIRGSPKKFEQAKVNAANKKYNHHLGAVGYKKSVKKW